MVRQNWTSDIDLRELTPETTKLNVGKQERRKEL